MGTSLTCLEQKKLNLGLKRLTSFGIDVQRWLVMLDATDAEMQRLALSWPIFTTPYAYDAVALLGFGPASTDALPEVRSGEVLIRYGGWSLQELRDSAIGKELMDVQDWYDKYPWSAKKLPAGIYRLRIPVPGSSHKTVAEQERDLPNGEHTAPAVLVATALIVHRRQMGEDLLKGAWTRFRDRTAADRRGALDWRDGRLYVYSVWDHYRHGNLWTSSVRTS